MSEKKIDILIVEDDTKIRKLLRLVLKKFGYESVTEAENGKEAWEYVQENQYDLVMTDWSMPEMDGLQLLKSIRSSERAFKDVPVIMITAFGATHNIREAADWKVNGYVVKPFNVQTVADKIVEVIGVS